MFKKNTIIVLILLTMNMVFGVEVKKIIIQGFEGFKGGTFKNIILDAGGTMMIGPKTLKLNSPEDEYFLSLHRDQNNNILIGTGHEGGVFKMSPGKKPIKIFKGDDLDIYALTVLKSGDILAGTSPSGKIYKINKENKSSVFFDPRERMIWDIAEDNSRNIYCAVGVQGAVYKLSQSGTGRKLPGMDDFHILSLFVTKDNRLIVGSGENGILYEYKNLKTRVLFDTPYSEIKGICEDDSGNLYFSATSGGYISNRIKILSSEIIGSSKSLVGKKKIVKPVFYKSILYKMDKSGVVEQIWKLKDDYIYDIVWDKINKGVVISTGNSGRIYRMKPDGEYAMLYEGDFSQGYKLIAGENSINLISNNSMGIYQIDYTSAQKGEYFSKVFDMKVKSLIGKIYWNRGYKATKGLNLFVRMGNASKPDSSWTEWSVPFSDKENSNVNISGFRYFQIKTVFNDLNLNSPVKLHNIYVYYLQSNIKPKINKITVKPGIKEKAKMLKANWTVEDKNYDRLNYVVGIKKVKGNKWMQLKKEYSKKELVINPQLFEDGVYHLQIKVDDNQDNPDGGKVGEKVSKPFIIDSTAPVIQGFTKLNNTVSFTVVDSVSVIYKVHYSFDRKNWFSVFPKDQINDSQKEDFTLKVQGEKSYLFIKVVDETLNEKVFQKAL